MYRHYVHVSKEALVQMLLNGFEAFAIKHQNKKRHAIEMHSSLYGSAEETATTLHHHVDFISVDTSAEMTGNSVTIKCEARSLKETMSRAAGFKNLGTLHTHPYLSSEMTLDEVRAVGSRFSPKDLVNFGEEFKEGKFDGNQFALHSVLTIRNKGDDFERQRIDCDGLLNDNIFEFSMANCKCFLNVQVFSIDQNNAIQQERTFLKCDYLQNFKYFGSDFGKICIVAGKKRIVEHRK